MANLLQKRLAENIANGGLKKFNSKKALLVNSGYKPTTAKENAKKIISSKGVIEELAKIGFTEEAAKTAISEILEKPLTGKTVSAGAKIMAAQEVFKVFGTYAPIKQTPNIEKAIIILPVEIITKNQLNANNFDRSSEENSNRQP